MTSISAKTEALLQTSDFVFEIKHTYFWDILILDIFYFMIYIHNFQGDLTAISAKKRSLLQTSDFVFEIEHKYFWDILIL